MPTLVAELGVPLWATGQALGSHCSSRGAEKPPFPRKIEIWRDIGGGSHYFRWPQSYPIPRPPPPSSLVQKKPRPDQVTFSVFAPNFLTHRRAALSRAISERRSRGVTPAQKKEGPGWSHGAHEDVLARFSPPRPAPLGPVRRRPARRVPRPVTPTPARTAHLQPSRGYSCAHAGEPGGTPFPPPPTG